MSKNFKKAYNEYMQLINTKQRKYTLTDIQTIYDVLKTFYQTNKKGFVTFNTNVAAFFNNNGYDVAMDDNSINYIIFNS